MSRPSLLLLVAAAGCSGPARAPAPLTSFEYPAARRGNVVDVHHGVSVPDPYRWLEDGESDETRAWIEAQNELTFRYLDTIPARDRIRDRLTELWNYERWSVPIARHGRYFVERNDGLQDQAVLHVLDGRDAEPRVLLDPNGLSDDGTIALADVKPSEDGRLLAYGLSDGGSDWRIWRVRDVDTGEDTGDVVTRNKFGRIEWAPDGSGFYYMRYDVPPEGAELSAFNAPPDLCFHRLGTPEEEDAVLRRRPTREGVNHWFHVGAEGKTLVVVDWEVATRGTEVSVLDLATGTERKVVSGFDAQHYVLADRGDALLLFTDLDAPNWRIVAVDPLRPAREHWVDLVPEAAEPIDDAERTGDRLYVHYLKDARSVVRTFALDGAPLGEVDLPGLGTVSGFEGLPDATETFYSFRSFNRPSTVYRYDARTSTSEVFRAPELRFDPDEFVTAQVFYESADGTRVPMFVTHRRDLVVDGDEPTYLYGYGGFNISMTPSFSVSMLVWMELGGVFAQANLRGGGEYGESWHEAGTRLSKQNVFDDFVAAAEWLIANGFTTSERLAIGGGSNGGLLVGACMIQRPDLFGACLPAVGVMDMLRYHLFTIGWGWAGDYGTADDPEEFQALLAYSPYHNLEPGTAYPPTLVTTADRDDRVVPAHSFKFAAALQAAHRGDDPVLIRIETRAGHGAGKSTRQRIDEAADRWAFLVRELGMEDEPLPW